MAKAKGPLHSLDARGSLGKNLIYKGNKSLNVIKKFRTPKNPRSSGQTSKRSLFALAIQGWQALYAWTKTSWDVEKIKTGKIMSGYNYYISEYLRSMAAGDTPAVLSPEFINQNYRQFSNNGDWVWTYRREINITNGSGGTLTDYQVKITLDNTNMSFGKAQVNGEDIRFGSEDDSLELNYWIESYSQPGETAEIWIKVPSIPVSGIKIYIYYGNAYASNSSAGRSTFIFYEDFESGQGDWTVDSGTFTIQNGRMLNGIGAANGVNHIITGATPGAVAIEYDYRFGATGGENQAGRMHFITDYLKMHRLFSALYTNSDGGDPQIGGIDWGTGVNHKVQLWWWGGGANEFKVGVDDGATDTGTLTTVAKVLDEIEFTINDGAWGPSEIDNIIIRKYVLSEPTTSIEDEETK